MGGTPSPAPAALPVPAWAAWQQGAIPPKPLGSGRASSLSLHRAAVGAGGAPSVLSAGDGATGQCLWKRCGIRDVAGPGCV